PGTRPVHPVQRTPGLLLLVGVASLAALIGFMSNNWYRDLRERHTSKTQNKAATASQVLSRVFAPGGPSTVASAGSVAASTRPPETTPPPDHSASNLRV